MQSIITKTKQAMANNGRIRKTALVMPASILLAVTLVTPSVARPHHEPLRPIKSSSYNPDQSRRDSSCFNVPGLTEIYACSANGG
jgi:hypothetical protein